MGSSLQGAMTSYADKRPALLFFVFSTRKMMGRTLFP